MILMVIGSAMLVGLGGALGLAALRWMLEETQEEPAYLPVRTNRTAKRTGTLTGRVLWAGFQKWRARQPQQLEYRPRN